MIRTIGRTRRKLAELLTRETGLTFLPEKCWPTEGYYRTSNHIYNDAFRWSACPEERGHRVLDSYATMTECVKKGIVIDWDSGEIFAKESD